MKIVRLYIASVQLIVTTCKNQKSESENLNGQEQQTEMTAHNSQNSLDWAGVYRRTLPCADCEGIKTEIKLNQDLSYVKAVKYMGTNDEFTQSSATFFLG